MASEPSDEKLEKRARNVLLYQISRSMKTKQQLAQILVKREIPDHVALPLLDRFEEAQLINDAEFARAFVVSKLATGGKSAMALRRELRQKGLADDLIAEALSDLDQEQEQQIANKLAISRYQRLLKLEPDVRYRRLSGFLMRRGFSSAITTRAIREAQASG
jgi:regulatory protein